MKRIPMNPTTNEPIEWCMSFSEIGKVLNMKPMDVAYLERRAMKYIADELRNEIRRVPLLRDRYGHFVGIDQ